MALEKKKKYSHLIYGNFRFGKMAENLFHEDKLNMNLRLSI